MPPSRIMNTASPEMVQYAKSGYALDTNRLMSMPPMPPKMPATTNASKRMRQHLDAEEAGAARIVPDHAQRVAERRLDHVAHDGERNQHHDAAEQIELMPGRRGRMPRNGGRGTPPVRPWSPPVTDVQAMMQLCNSIWNASVRKEK